MNKLSFYILVVAIAFVSCNGDKHHGDEQVAHDQESIESIAGNFGAELSDNEISDLTILQTTLDSEDEFTGKLEVEIEDVCQMKGCWMTAKLPDGRTMRITFKDYGFFVPKNATGYTAVIEGKAVKRMTDEETLRHYAEESGQPQEEIDKIDGPGEELSFVASGVEIKSL